MLTSERRRFSEALDLTSVDQRFRDRFASKVAEGGPGECWEWQGYCKPNGYGQFTLEKGHFVTASRAALAMVTPLADGEVACHRCDNPPCVNPAHLFVGTQVDNALDCIRKGRGNHSHGEAHFSARLTGAQVAFIRSQDLRRHGLKSQLAREFGVSLTAIRRVISGETWSHVA